MSVIVSWIASVLAMFTLAVPAEAPAVLAAEYPEPAQAQVLGTLEWDEFTYDFGFPPVDSVFWWNLPFTRPHMRNNWPAPVSLSRLVNDFRNEPEQQLWRLPLLVMRQWMDDDFAFVISNYPRIAFVFDSELREFRGINDEGAFHLGFNYNFDHGFFFATRNSWKRLFGFNDFYDWLSNHSFNAFNLQTERVIFEYDGLEYMVQLWRGTYAFDFFTGAEVGFYTRPLHRRVEHWDVLPLAQAFPMGMRVTAGETVFMDLGMRDTWWVVMAGHRIPSVQPPYLNLYWTGDFSGRPGLGQAFYAAVREQFPDFDVEMNGNVMHLRWGADYEVP